MSIRLSIRMQVGTKCTWRCAATVAGWQARATCNIHGRSCRAVHLMCGCCSHTAGRPDCRTTVRHAGPAAAPPPPRTPDPAPSAEQCAARATLAAPSAGSMSAPPAAAASPRTCMHHRGEHMKGLWPSTLLVCIRAHNDRHELRPLLTLTRSRSAAPEAYYLEQSRPIMPPRLCSSSHSSPGGVAPLRLRGSHCR